MSQFVFRDSGVQRIQRRFKVLLQEGEIWEPKGTIKVFITKMWDYLGIVPNIPIAKPL